MDDAQHWRNRAEAARVQAVDMYDEGARRKMLAIAAGYDRLAERAEQRATKREAK
jgi:hypothetical protein